jgi:hypothetical protein
MARFGQILFVMMWLAVLSLSVTVQLTMRAHYNNELAIIHHLGGVPWDYQSDKDDTIFVVRHTDGYFGLISLISSEFVTIMLWFAGIGLILGAVLRWVDRTGLTACVILSGFLVVFGIIAAATLPAGPASPAAPFDTVFNPAARHVTAYGNVMGLCGLTGGHLLFQPGTRSDSWDVDALSDGRSLWLDSFHNVAAANALLAELTLAQRRAGCP